MPGQAKELELSVDEPNFYVAPSLALIANDPANFDKNMETIKSLKYSFLFVSAPEKDIFGKLWNINLPLYKYEKSGDITSLLQLAKDKTLLLDGFYQSKDDEFLEVKNTEGLLVR